MAEEAAPPRHIAWKSVFSRKRDSDGQTSDENVGEERAKSRWNMGMLNDKETIEVPGKDSICNLSCLSDQLTGMCRIGSVACKGTKRASGSSKCSRKNIPLFAADRHATASTPACGRQEEDKGWPVHLGSPARRLAQRPAKLGSLAARSCPALPWAVLHDRWWHHPADCSRLYERCSW